MKTYPNRNTRLIFLVCATLLTASVRAQESAPDTATPVQAKDGGVASDTVFELSPFEVSASKDNKYMPTNAASGTRIALPLESTPLAISIMTSELMKDKGMENINEAIRFMPGIRRNANNSDQFTIRGFQARAARRNYFSDAADLSEGRGRNVSAEIERIEVLKGPSTVLFGFGNPGGVINIITKKPLNKQRTSVSLEAGDFDLFRGTIDVTGPLAKLGEAQLLYRVIGSYEDSGGFRDFESRDQKFVNAQLQLNFKRTQLRTEVRFQDLKEHEAFILMPFEPNTGTLALPERSYNTAGPDTYANQKQITTSVELTHTFNEHFSMRAAAARDEHYYDAVRRVGAQIPANQVPLSMASTVVVTGNIDDDKRAIDSWQVDFTGSFDLPFGKLKTVVGASSTDAAARIATFVNNNLPQRNFPIFNIAARNYSVGNLSDYVPQSAGTTRETRLDKVYYALGTLTAWNDRLTLLAGVGHGTSETYIKQVLATTPADVGDFKVTKPQFGASLRILPKTFLFANTSESASANLRFPDTPEKGKSYDVGIKVAAEKFSGSVTYFDTTRENIQVQVFNGLTGTTTFELSGEEQAKGVEVEFQYFPSNQFQLVGSYSYMDTEVISDNQRPARVGTELPDTPRNSYRLWAKYTLDKGPFKRAWIGVGYLFTDKMRGNRNPANFRIWTDSWSRIDASLGYDMKIGKTNVNWVLTMENLEDKDYIDYMLIRGRPFNARLSATFTF
ncbi:TonB-dependent siderophore receptor [Oleiharenicola sp. Vm1]|uniref:TonB-dependent siderophore receptor n=1 Tax=Oleiharenicola sp. Vm1 TaxID=3398393 RepID=UPI001D2B5AFC|nr:TonB-dependent receptor [Candidatus Didemnitutus sp.]